MPVLDENGLKTLIRLIKGQTAEMRAVIEDMQEQIEELRRGAGIVMRLDTGRLDADVLE